MRANVRLKKDPFCDEYEGSDTDNEYEYTSSQRCSFASVVTASCAGPPEYCAAIQMLINRSLFLDYISDPVTGDILIRNSTPMSLIVRYDEFFQNDALSPRNVCCCVSRSNFSGLNVLHVYWPPIKGACFTCRGSPVCTKVCVPERDMSYRFWLTAQFQMINISFVSPDIRQCLRPLTRISDCRLCESMIDP